MLVQIEKIISDLNDFTVSQLVMYSIIGIIFGFFYTNHKTLKNIDLAVNHRKKGSNTISEDILNIKDGMIDIQSSVLDIRSDMMEYNDKLKEQINKTKLLTGDFNEFKKNKK